MNEDMKADPLENLNNVDFPGIKQEIVKEEICEEELPDLPNYVTVKDEMVINKLDTDLQQEVHKTDPEGQLSRSEHSVGDSGDTEQLSPLKIKTECEFEEFDQPEQIPVEDIDSILFEGTETKVKSEFGSTEDSNEQTDEILEKDSASHVETQPVSIKTLFKCEVCSKGYVKEAVKNRHMCAHFGKGPVPCTICGEGIEKRELYIQHYGTHLGDLSGFYCETCYKKFTSQADLDHHLTSHRNLTSKPDPAEVPRAKQKCYQCRYCPKKLSNRSDFLGHESLHGKPLFQCPLCLKNFGKTFELEKHKRIHTGSKPFSCEICSKAFVQRGSLTVHLKTAHSDEKPFRCSLCPITFAYSSSLQRHMRNHGGERPYKCKECSKSFKMRYLLDEHVMNHTDELPFACAECPKKFRRLSTLTRHYRSHYSTDGRARPFPCGTCDKSFTKSESLQRHLASHDDERDFKCDSCAKTFKDEDSLKNHQASHEHARVVARPFECHLCSRRFTTLNRRDIHVESHPTKPSKCEMCDKEFEKKETLRLHMRVHTRVHCEVCSKEYRSLANLKRHMVTHSKGVECYVSEPPKNRHMRVHFGKGPVPCTMCGEEFEKRTCYIQHYGTHFEELYQFHCLGCYNKFPTQAKLDEHRTAHHDAAPKLEPEDAPLASQKRYPCRYCSKDFPNRSDLLGHESLHNGKKLSQCPICQKNFAKPVELHKHERTHTGSRPFSCELCSKSYVQQGALTVHRKIAHSNEKAFRCGECPKIFAYGYSLRRHLRHHRGERPHKCDECSMSFPSRYALDEHVTIHTGELPFACTQCPQRFRRPWYLKSHYRVHASTREVRRFQCGACDKSFSTNEILKRHGALHGDQQFKCSTCWKAFKNEINLEKHKLIYHTERVGAQDIARPFDCHLCARRFTTKYKRDTHVGSHPTEPLPCGVCDKRFEKKENLRMHLRVHSENRFTCEVCSKVFRNARNHRRHMTIHSKVEEVAV